MTTAELISAVRKHAVRNYEKGGWDYVVECFSDAELEKIIGRCTGTRGAIDKVKAYITPMANYRDDVRGEIF